MAYHLKYVGEEIDNLLDKADTALQEHQDISYLATKEELSSGLGEDRSKIKELGDALETEVNRAVNAEKELSDKIDKKVSDLIESAPETLDTLRELADALQDSDSSFNKALNNKVDKVEGKGLSTNDYTTTEKNKLAGLQNYDDSDVRKLKGEVETLTGNGEGSVVDIASKEVAKVIDSAPETMDTLKKIADLIEKDAEQTADILATLGGHESRISTLEDKFVVMSEADYDALPNKEDKFYFCYDE